MLSWHAAHGCCSLQLMAGIGVPPLPLLQALMSNIGGAATMVGDPPALIIGTALSNYLGGWKGASRGMYYT